MRILHYSDIDNDRVKACQELARSIVDEFNVSRMKLEGSSHCVTSLQLAYLLASLPEGNFDLHDKVVLDIGCGSTSSPDGSDYEPNLKRVLNHGEVCVVGFDLRADCKDLYPPTRIVDLTNPHAFDFVKCHSVDIVHSRGLVDSPTLERIVEAKGVNDSLLGLHKENFERILKPTGYVLWCDNFIGGKPGVYRL